MFGHYGVKSEGGVIKCKHMPRIGGTKGFDVIDLNHQTKCQQSRWSDNDGSKNPKPDNRAVQRQDTYTYASFWGQIQFSEACGKNIATAKTWSVVPILNRLYHP